jgi:DNA-binding transcriptional LysR family regulator
MRDVNIDGLDLATLEVLATLLSERSVSRTAARLGFSQPGVSHVLARLRTALGDTLLVRGSRGFVLTPRGEALAQAMPAMLQSLRATLVPSKNVFAPETSRRVFTISSADYAAALILPKIAQVLTQGAPSISVRVLPPAEPSVLHEALTEGTLDLAIVLESQAAPALRRQRLLRERFVSVVRSGHPVLRERMTLDVWLKLRHLVIAPRGQPGSIVDTVLARSGKHRDIAMSVPHFMVAPFVVAESDLVLTFAARLASRFAAQLRLHVFNTPIAAEGFSLVQIWHERMHADQGHTWLRRTMFAAARAAD